MGRGLGEGDSTIQQKRKAPRAFVTFVPNERRELVQLTFDVAEFNRDRRTEVREDPGGTW